MTDMFDTTVIGFLCKSMLHPNVANAYKVSQDTKY